MELHYELNPEYVENESGKNIVEAAIQDLSQIMIKLSDNVATHELLTDVEAIQDMLKLSLDKSKFK